MSGPRKGRQQLAVLAEGLSERDRMVVKSVHDLRLVSARQLERLVFPVPGSHTTPLTAARTARRTLERLVRDRLLVRLHRRVGGVRAGSASFVYALGPVGQRVLGEEGPRRRFREPSAMFVAHTLAVSELYVWLHEAERSGQLQLLRIETEPSCWRSLVTITGSTIVKPDLFVIAGDESYEYRWLVEMDLGTEHAPAIARKCRAYQAYYQSGIEQQRHTVFPRVLWVAVDEERAERLQRIINSASGLNGQLFLVTTSHRAVKVMAGGTP